MTPARLSFLAVLLTWDLLHDPSTPQLPSCAPDLAWRLRGSLSMHVDTTAGCPPVGKNRQPAIA